MYAVDTASGISSLPFTTKSTLQALLKSREQLSIQRRRIASEVKKSLQNFYSINAESLHRGGYSVDPCLVPSPESVLINEDQFGDFSYSQKLFHSADGNLYSIFSPLQGRSYGMKPSFLRKQKCTVQECHGKGRRVLRKGLKFHNFLPSESVTSEKDGGHLQDQWRVHSECKLREEHGTKQIMVSNWFQNVRQSNDDCARTDATASTSAVPFSQPSSSADNMISLENEVDISSASDGTLDKPLDEPSLIVPSLSYEAITGTNEPLSSVKASVTSQVTEATKPHTDKHRFLDNLLQSVSNGQPSSSSSIKMHRSRYSSEYATQKHRRKPNQTRRVVPYTKYLSMLEETEAHPLDLSTHKKNSFENNVFNSPMKNTSVVGENSNVGESCNTSLKQIDKYGIAPKLIPITLNPSDYFVPQTLQIPQYMCNMSLNDNITIRPPQVHISKHESGVSKDDQNLHSILQFKLKNMHDKSKSSVSSSHSDRGSSNHIPSGVPSSSRSAKPRRKSQRSVIKQKLEDTFRQNGFLVKTKQVSDGEATFCKFRQLRKYTRYYLKSWQHHLPDEVHKMWKGFLPPKTVLPPPTGCTQNSVEDNN